MEIDAVPETVSGLRRRLRSWLAEAGVDDDMADDVLLAVGEAAANVVEHAYTDVDAGTMVVSASLRESELQLTVADTGTWQLSERDTSTGGGWGLQLIQEVMDETAVHTANPGTRVHMSRQVPQTGSA